MNPLQLSFVVASLLVGVAVSQAPQHAAVGTAAATSTANVNTPASGGCGLQEETDHLLGSGADYRVVFDRDGITFTPALGRQAPQEYPFRFSLASITRGGTTVYEHGASRVIAPKLAGVVAAFARSPGITERYEVRPEGVEQSFHFDHPLPGRGELVVRGTIHTDLDNAFRGESRHGLKFAGQFGGVTVGGVSIGGVTGIDADGHRATGTLRFDGTSIELVLPAKFVDHASYPLVLDPLIGTDSLVGSTSTEDTDSDVAYDAGSSGYLVVWTRPYSANTSDVLGQRMSDDGYRVGNLNVITAAGYNEKPSVGHNSYSDRCLCVWQSGTNANGLRDLWMRAINRDGSMSNSVPLVTAAGDQVDPDVANDPNWGEAEILVVWTRTGSGIRCAQVRVADGFADPVLRGPINVVTSNGFDSEPAISKGCGSSGIHAVVWTRDLPGNKDVYAASVDEDGVPLGTPAAVAAFSNRDEQSPDVDGDSDEFVVVFEVEESATSTESDIFTRRVIVSGSGITADGSRRAIDADSGQDERTPAIGFAEHRYVVAWCEDGIFGTDLRGVALLADDGAPCGEEFVISGPRDSDVHPEIATVFSAGRSEHHAMITFTSMDARGSSASEVRVQQFQAFGGGPVTTLHPSCGGGGTLTIEGAFALQNEVLIRGSAIDPAATLAALHIGSNAGTPLPCGSCWILEPFAAVPDTVVNQFAVVELALGDGC